MGKFALLKVPERVSTQRFVVWILGNSKSNHFGVQGTFNGSGVFLFTAEAAYLIARVPHSTGDLAFTRYCFTVNLFLRVNQPFIAPPTPPAKPTLLQYYCAIYDPLPRPTVGMPYTVPYWQWHYLVKANWRRSLTRVKPAMLAFSPFLVLYTPYLVFFVSGSLFGIHRRFIIQRGHEHTRTGN